MYGDKITALEQDDDDVAVTFAHAPPRRFDLVVLAEGMRSRTRDLVFGTAPEVRELGLYVAHYAIAREPADAPWWYWYVRSAPGAAGEARRCRVAGEAGVGRAGRG